MKYTLAPVLVLVHLVATASFLGAQGSAADYDRANSMGRLARGKVFKASIEPHWFAGDRYLWYRRDVRGKRDYVWIDTSAGVLIQDVLDAWQTARAVGFRGLAIVVGAVVPTLRSNEDQNTIDRLPKKLHWWRRSAFAYHGELLVAVDGHAPWREMAPLFMRCSKAGIWQIAFVARGPGKRMVKIPTHMTIGRIGLLRRAGARVRGADGIKVLGRWRDSGWYRRRR